MKTHNPRSLCTIATMVTDYPPDDAWPGDTYMNTLLEVWVMNGLGMWEFLSGGLK